MSKTAILFLIILLSGVQAIGQTREINLYYSGTKKAFASDSKIRGLKFGKNYKVVLNGIHTGFQDSKAKATQFDQVSSAPDALKFLSIPSTDVLDFKSLWTPLLFIPDDTLVGPSQDPLIDLMEKYNQLADNLNDQLKSTDTLHNNLLDRWKSQKVSFYDSAQSIAKAIIERVIIISDKVEDQDAGLTAFGYFMQTGTGIKLAVEAFLNNTDPNDLDLSEFLAKYAEFLHRQQVIEKNLDTYLRKIKFLYAVSKSVDPAQYTTRSLDVFSVKADQTQIKVNLIDQYRKDTLINQNIKLHTYGYFTFDFSTGFYYNSIKDVSVSSEAIEGDTTMVRLRNDDDSDFDLAIGGQLHATYKVWSDFGLGLNIGAGVSPFDGKTRYLFGSHFLLGRAKQVFLSLGVALANVKRFSDVGPDGEVDDEDGLVVPVAFATPKLVDKLNHSFFIGFSYNLSSTFKPRK